MAKPLRSSNPQPQDIQFKHFGVLNSGEQSKTSLFTSIAANMLLALIIVIIGAATKKVVDQRKADNLAYVVPVKPLPPEPPKPKLPPPPPPKVKIPPPPEVPKIKLPDVKLPDPPKVVEVKTPKPPTPIVTPAPPKVVVAAAAPKPTVVNLGKSASVPNNDPHPAAVSLGRQDSPIAPSNRPAVANAVNLGQQGLAGMPPGSGRGPASTAVNLGSGQPNGSLGGGGSRAVQGVKLGGITNGTPGGTGNGIGTSQPQQVALGHAPTPPAATTVATRATAKSAPTVVYKPAPVYTEEARSQHIEGTVKVHIHVTSSGQVQVVGVVSGLGHGLDQSALQVCQGMRFKPAMDSNGNATDWDGNVTVTFQLA